MRRVPAAVLLLLLLIASALAFALMWPAPPPGPIYTVAQVTQGMAHHPRAWYGHTVTVRGIAVQVEWSIQDAVGASGTEQDGCTAWRRCTMHVPTDTPLFVFLVAAVPHTGAVAYAQLRLALQMARNVAPAAPGAPPNLVVDALPQSVRLTELLQAFVPWPVVQALTHIPVIGHPLAHVATVQGGAPRLYRVRLGTGPPTLPGTPQQACTPACEDGELLDNLY